MERVSAAMLALWPAMVVVLVLTTYIPQLTTALPDLLMPWAFHGPKILRHLADEMMGCFPNRGISWMKEISKKSATRPMSPASSTTKTAAA